MALGPVLLVLAAGAVAVALLRGGAPGEAEARATARAYLDSLVADDCAYVDLLTERLRRERDLDPASCREAMQYEAGEYEEYAVLEVSVDGDRAVVLCEDASDSVSTFTLELRVVDGRWLVDDRIEGGDGAP